MSCLQISQFMSELENSGLKSLILYSPFTVQYMHAYTLIPACRYVDIFTIINLAHLKVGKGMLKVQKTLLLQPTVTLEFRSTHTHIYRERSYEQWTQKIEHIMPDIIKSWQLISSRSQICIHHDTKSPKMWAYWFDHTFTLAGHWLGWFALHTSLTSAE